jgi:hypothetical protein
MAQLPKEDTLEIAAFLFQFNNFSPSRWLPTKEVLPEASVRSDD